MATAEPDRATMPDVGWRFLLLYTLAYTSTCLVFLAPLLVTLALKVNSLVGLDRAPNSLALVAGIGAAVAVVANPFFGKLSDRTTSHLGMRRPWIVAGLVAGSVGVLIVALAPSIPLVLLGWCVAQLGFNALLATMVAVLPDRVPVTQRGMVAGVLGVCLPVASVAGTFLVKLFSGYMLAMFLVPCALGGFFIVLFAITMPDRRLDRADRPPWSVRELAITFWVDPPQPGLRVGFRQPVHVRPGLRLPGHLSGVLPVGPPRERRGRCAASGLPGNPGPVRRAGCSFFARREAVRPNGTAEGLRRHRLRHLRRGDVLHRRGQQLQRLPRRHGMYMYMAVDLALVVDVLPDPDTAAKDLGVLNIAGALPSAVAPAVAPAILAMSGGSYAMLYAVAGVCALLAAAAIFPVKGVR
ncbi:MFS transporter [Knoellia locipacati]|uniref:MFS transporter n=1 Tax=Knoellia locipacati TaxID=882824 RepID=UPI00384BE0D1